MSARLPAVIFFVENFKVNDSVKFLNLTVERFEILSLAHSVYLKFIIAVRYHYDK